MTTRMFHEAGKWIEDMIIHWILGYPLFRQTHIDHFGDWRAAALNTYGSVSCENWDMLEWFGMHRLGRLWALTHPICMFLNRQVWSWWYQAFSLCSWQGRPIFAMCLLTGRLVVFEYVWMGKSWNFNNRTPASVIGMSLCSSLPISGAFSYFDNLHKHWQQIHIHIYIYTRNIS